MSAAPFMLEDRRRSQGLPRLLPDNHSGLARGGDCPSQLRLSAIRSHGLFQPCAWP
jgi:hypothetical protein